MVPCLQKGWACSRIYRRRGRVASSRISRRRGRVASSRIPRRRGRVACSRAARRRGKVRLVMRLRFGLVLHSGQLAPYFEGLPLKQVFLTANADRRAVSFTLAE